MKNDRAIEYKMTSKMFHAMLDDRTEDEKKMNPYVYVMSVINEQFGLRGSVKRILISDGE